MLGKVLYYEIYICPEKPTEYGKYYGKTPLLVQARGVVETARRGGKNLFIKAVYPGGIRITLL